MRIKGIHVNDKVTADAVIAACERRRLSLDNPGFCIVCGCEAEGVEPDAEGYRCESCGAETGVYGCEDLLVRMVA